MSFITPDGHVSEEFAKTMVFLAEAWRTKLTEAQIRVYAKALSDLSPEQLKAACSRTVRECQFFPTIAELRRGIDPSPEDAGVLAWSHARRAASVVGGYVNVTFDDGAIASALQAVFGSWSEFCQQEEGPQLHTRRQEFLAAYRTYRLRGLHKAPLTLAGLCETSPASGKALAGHVFGNGEMQLAPSTALAKRGDQ